MLGNIVRVRHVSRVIRYVLDKPGAQVLAVDSLTGDTDQFAAEILHLAEHRPRLQKPIAHADINLRPGLRLSDKEWREVAQHLRAQMGYSHSPFLLVRHQDADHDHVHALMGTVRYDGTVVPDSYEIKRFHAAVGQSAEKLGMRVERARDRSAGHRSLYWFEQRGDPLKEIVAEAYKASTLAQWQARLKERGVEPSYHLRRDGYLQGLVFKFGSRWVKARALGKQFAAAQVRKQFDLTPSDLRLMVRQNQEIGRGRTELAVDPSHGQAPAVLIVQPDAMESRPSLAVPDPGAAPPSPPRSRRLETLLGSLEKPTMPLRIDEYVARQRPAPSSWLEGLIARRIHESRHDDATYHAAARLLASRILEAPEHHPRLVLRLAQEESPHPRLEALLERVERAYALERHLPHLAADPEAYAPRYSRILRLHSGLLEARIQQAREIPGVPELERRIRAALLPQRHADLPRIDFRAWRQDLLAGRRSDATSYLIHYKRRLEDQLARAVPSLRSHLAGMEQRAATLPADSLERYAYLGRAAALKSYLTLHPAPSGAPARPRRPRRSRLYDVLRYLYSPRRTAQLDLAQLAYRRVHVDQLVRAFRRMRSPLRGVVRELANNAGRPYLAAAVLVPAAVLRRQVRQVLERTVFKDYFDHSVEQKMLLRILRGRPLAAALHMAREGLTSGVER